MAREDRTRISPRAETRTPLARLRAAYYAFPPRTRLFAALAAVTAAAALAYLAAFPVLLAIVIAVAALSLFAALMRSSDAVATALVSLVWLVLAYVLFQIPISVADSSVLLLLPLIPLLVALGAARITAFPVWHTTLLALLVGLIVGLAVALAGLLTDTVGPGAGVAVCAVAAATALGWRALAGYRLRRGMEPRDGADAAAGRRPGGSGLFPRAGSRTGDLADHRTDHPTDGAADRRRDRATEGGKGGPGARDGEVPEPIPVDQALARLENMIGLDPVKQQVRAIAASIEAARLRADAGYSVEKPLRHLVFSGPPGTGKTSVARTLATIFHSFGLLPTPHVVEAQRADLVGEYLGATAIKTNELVDRALGGVLFIDEAYSLVNDGDGQPDRFGNEAVQTLLKRAEDDRERLVVILAGYETEMDRFLASNPGLASRFATRVTFPSYTAEELRRISEHHFEQRGDLVEDTARPVLRRRFDQVVQRGVIDDLGNGRFVRSLVEKSAEARDVRVVTAGHGGGRPVPDDLVTVRAADIVTAFDELTARLPGFGRHRTSPRPWPSSTA